jgi:hypothetical protein
MLIIET